jgi:ABC-type ATPase involved in cell division
VKSEERSVEAVVIGEPSHDGRTWSCPCASRPRSPSVNSNGRRARALLLAPIVLLADEPTGHQDAEMAERVMSRLRSNAAGGTACLVATHSPEAVAFAHRVLGIRDGRVPEAHADILRP